MKKKVLIIGAAVILVVVVIWIFKPFGKESSEYAFETVKVTKGKISNVVTATGTIEAEMSVQVGTQVSGIIEKVYVDFNDKVKKGQLLAQLDIKQLQTQLVQSKATLDQADAQLIFQEATYNRMKALFEKKLIAQSDYDQAMYNYQNAVASKKNASSSYERNLVNLNYATITSPIDGVVLNRAIEQGQTVAASFNTPTLFTIVNDLTQMKVETSVDEADIGKVRQDQRVEFTVDAYPDKKFEGKVSQVRLQPTTTNNVVTYTVVLSAPNPEKKLMPGMTASATIYVEEKDSVLMLSGKAMRFIPDMAYMKKQMSRMMQNMPKGTKRPGMPSGAAVSGTMATNRNQNSGAPPSGMGTFPQMPPGGFTGSMPDGSKMVWVKNGKGGIRPNRITTGIDNGTFVEVKSGLKEGDEVVVSMTGGTSDKSTGTAATQNRPRGPFPF